MKEKKATHEYWIKRNTMRRDAVYISMHSQPFSPQSSHRSGALQMVIILYESAWRDVCLFFPFLFELFVTLIFVSTLFITNAIFHHRFIRCMKCFCVCVAFVVVRSKLFGRLGSKPPPCFWHHFHNLKKNENEKRETQTHTQNGSKREKRWSETFFANSFVLTLWAISKVLFDRELQM